MTFTSGKTSHVKYYVVATFTPRSSHISNARFTHSLLLAISLAAGRRSAPQDRAIAGLLLCVDSLLNRYLLVSGSVRVRRGIVGLLGLGLGSGLGLGLALGLQLGIGIGFRRNHSWSSIFTHRRNHSLCLNIRPCFICKYHELDCNYYLKYKKFSKADRLVGSCAFSCN